MKEYLRMSDVFPDGVCVGTEWWMNGWFEVRHVGGSSIDESCDGGYSERDANYIAHAINSHDELVQVNKNILAALEEVVGCFDAADIEGWQDAFSSNDTSAMKELYSRRTSFARYAAEDAIDKAKCAQSNK
ncbi:hypothetical protein D3C79_367670 [compost metagenome]